MKLSRELNVIVRPPLTSRGKLLLKEILKRWELYVFLIPAVVAIFVFSYMPLYGLQLAFKDLFPGRPFSDAVWVGLDHYRRFFNGMWFWPVLKNTIKLSLAVRFVEWPFPIILALLLHNCYSKKLKNFTQTVTYIPYLISVVIVIGIMRIFLDLDLGLVNILIRSFGGKEVYFFASEKWVLPMYLISDLWQTVGFSSIIYYAALSTIDPEISEAAIIDGANKVKRIWYIDLPTIAPTIITMLILNLGKMFQVGVEKILLLQTPLNLNASEIISTYVYKMGVVQGQLGFATAIGLLNNVVNFIILIIVNAIAKKYSETSVF